MRVGLVISVSTIIVVLLAPAALSANWFTDDNGSPHEGYINAIATEGITLGCNPPANDRFCPRDAVLRGQMAAFINRARDLPPTPTDFFTDDDGSMFEDDINRIAAAGITVGCNPPDNDRFCPDAVVGRAQMASFLARAFDLSDGAGADLFGDDDGSPHEDNIDRIAAAGITVGCSSADTSLFCPARPVLRDQMATFLGRALGLTPESAGEYSCTEVIGFSQTRQWYDGDPGVVSTFEAIVGDDAWQLRARSGAAIDIIADPGWEGWSADAPSSECTSGPVDRVVLTVSGDMGAAVDQWRTAIEDAVVTVRDFHPTVEQILLQPVVGGPDHQECFVGKTIVRASWQHAHIEDAIDLVAAGDSGVAVGADPLVGSCSGYSDDRGHLTDGAPVGSDLGNYYAGS